MALVRSITRQPVSSMHASKGFTPWWEGRIASELLSHSVTQTIRYIRGICQHEIQAAYDVHHVILQGLLGLLPCNGHRMWLRSCSGMYARSALCRSLLQTDLLTHIQTQEWR